MIAQSKKNSKCSLCGDRDETVKQVISEMQKASSTGIKKKGGMTG